MAIKVHVWRITGRSPLMQSNPEQFITGEDPGSGALSAKKKVYVDADEAKNRLYVVDGKFCHPSAAFRKAMLIAVKGRKYGKQAARNIIAAAVFPVEEYGVICDEAGKPVKSYEIDARPVVVKSGQKLNRIRRVRPKFPKWAINLPLEIDTDLIQVDQVTEALNLCGRLIGIGEFRPDPSDGKSGIGTFGRFSAELVK